MKKATALKLLVAVIDDVVFVVVALSVALPQSNGVMILLGRLWYICKSSSPLGQFLGINQIRCIASACDGGASLGCGNT